jgi:hypothetical protein
VVNLSLGGTGTPETDPLESTLSQLSAVNGTLFVVAVGNHGPSDTPVGSPGSADEALTVGAVDKNANQQVTTNAVGNPIIEYSSDDRKPGRAPR